MNRLRTGGSPLAYVTREEVLLPEDVDGEEDPGEGLPTLQEESVCRTRRDGSHWDTDNQAVWKIIRALAHGGPAWNWVSSHAKKRDGRSAYLDLKKYYLGSSFVAKTISDATSNLKTIFYNGRSKNFTFESFCGKLNKAFTDLLGWKSVSPLPNRARLRQWVKLTTWGTTFEILLWTCDIVQYLFTVLMFDWC